MMMIMLVMLIVMAMMLTTIMAMIMLGCLASIVEARLSAAKKQMGRVNGFIIIFALVAGDLRAPTTFNFQL